MFLLAIYSVYKLCKQGDNRQVSVQFSCLVVSDSLQGAAHQASLSITNSWGLPKLVSIESVMPSHYLILCRPLFPLPSIFPSIRVYSNESALRIRWPKYWSFSFNISPSKEHPGLISFRMDWLDFLAVQGTLKSLLQQIFPTQELNWGLLHCRLILYQMSYQGSSRKVLVKEGW